MLVLLSNTINIIHPKELTGGHDSSKSVQDLESSLKNKKRNVRNVPKQKIKKLKKKNEHTFVRSGSFVQVLFLNEKKNK